jgi:hypothetical protein
MFHGRWPTGTVATAPADARSITDTVASPPFETYSHLPSGCRATPLLRRPALILASTLNACASMTKTSFAFSAAT